MATKRKSRRTKTSPHAVEEKSRVRPTTTQLNDFNALTTGYERPTIECYNAARGVLLRILSAADGPPDSIDTSLFLLSARVSVRVLSGYATLDRDHIESIQSLIKNIEEYSEDLAQKRPLNFLMLASPG